jgi:hypothetical protein
MTIDCPHGFKRVTKLKTVTWEDQTVAVFDGICDSCDLCGIRRCEFYDDTREGTRRFQRAAAHAHTLEGMLAERDRQRAYRESRRGS